MPESQQSIMDWAKDTFGDPTPARAALRALEEMVELCVEAGCDMTDIYLTVDSAHDAATNKAKGLAAAPEEIADVVITLHQLARVVGLSLGRELDIASEVDRKMVINRNRKWALDGLGSGQHVEELS